MRNMFLKKDYNLLTFPAGKSAILKFDPLSLAAESEYFRLAPLVSFGEKFKVTNRNGP